jgi:hypothetical protein
MLPEAGGQVVQEDGCLEPGEVQPREQPLPVAKGGEGAAAAPPCLPCLAVTGGELRERLFIKLM